MAESRYETKILVVDDEKLVRMVISAKLRQAGYECVAVGDVATALATLKAAPKTFVAVVSDIVMGDIDGFVFRDMVRGIKLSIPFFFLTALDPEEGGGFLMRILEDPQSYYLPKSVKTDVLINRVRRVVASRHIETFINRKMEDDRRSMDLASHIQHSMLPVRAIMTPRGFYTTWWRPMDAVSGDLYEAMQFGYGCFLYVLGDIQGHGTSAALAMTAVQSFLKTLMRREGAPYMSPAEIANMLQRFFRANLADVSYMTALICIHRPLSGDVLWISCGAPDLVVIDGGKLLETNPGHLGGLPVGLMPDTEYTEADVITTKLSQTAVCAAYTDGLLDISQDQSDGGSLPIGTVLNLMTGLSEDARTKGANPAFLAKLMTACSELGYTKFNDDVTLLTFGARLPLDGVYESTFSLTPAEIDAAAQEMCEWCGANGWPEAAVGIVQLVFEEKLMNVYDHGFDDRTRLHEVASVRLVRRGDSAELTVWDNGSPEPSIAVVTGDSATAFDMANSEFSNHGRGRLMVRELCDMTERNRYGTLNETVYHIPFGKHGNEVVG